MDDKDKRIKELEEAAMELFILVHDSDRSTKQNYLK
jgi:hypothetical protein